MRILFQGKVLIFVRKKAIGYSESVPSIKFPIHNATRK